MTIIKKLTAAAAASTLALSLGMAANAEVMLLTDIGGEDVNDDGILDSTDVFEFVNDEALRGPLQADRNTIDLQVAEDVGTVFLDYNTDQSIPSGDQARGIQNFSIDVTGDMGTEFTVTGITNAAGVLQFSGPGSFSVMGGETLTFVFNGTAFRQGPLFPGYSVGVFGEAVFDAVPLPGAAVLFMTAAGAGALRLRKKAA